MSEGSKYQVVVSSQARDMLFEHAKFLARVSAKAAEELFDHFEENITSLEGLPERCAYYNNPYIRHGKYRKLALGKYLLILFQVTDNTVYIELIIDARAENIDRDWMR
ncbi:MAG: type II toxin-antitoxin system RelE/ParE family toxin [Peptococcaceae bacterium]|jgi:hypothetical protein|nr:type II toxin-antitoxin system RelE/ParE family toxin [Peptococcaceae bacterium]